MSTRLHLTRAVGRDKVRIRCLSYTTKMPRVRCVAPGMPRLILAFAVSLVCPGLVLWLAEAALHTSSPEDFRESQAMLELPPAHPWDVADSHALLHGSGHRWRTLHQQDAASLMDVKIDTHHLPHPKYLKPEAGSPASLPAPPAASGVAAAAGSGSITDKNRERGSSSGSVAQQRHKSRYQCSLSRIKAACQEFAAQTPEAVKPVLRGSTVCPGGCGLGNCHYDLGLCMCPAGWQGRSCDVPLKRPCTNRLRAPSEPLGIIISHINATTREDLNWTEPGWTASRCAGYCDEDIAMCYCGRGSKYAYVPAALGSPPGAPPEKVGRSMLDPCKPATDEFGNLLITVGRTKSWEDFYGPVGWCNVDEGIETVHTCGCGTDELIGHYCVQPKEAFCPTQCSGHGACRSGFCKCSDGWYGTDCSRKQAGAEMEPSSFPSSPWLLPSVKEGSASSAGSSSSNKIPRQNRRRPFIYVYDLPPEFNSRLLQYRLDSWACAWRQFHGPQNTSLFVASNGYAIETFLHEALLLSLHRTFDPEEADFFYVPVYITCLIYPVLGFADYPFYYAPSTGPRPMHAAHLLLEAKRWLQQAMPWWDRRGGRDHIWLMAHDEGACYMPTEIYNTSIMLTHWGRLDLAHTSGTGYPPDNYTLDVRWPGYQETDWRALYQGHACHTPGKDLVIPLFKAPIKYKESPLLGAAALGRDVLLYFRGDVGLNRHAGYSRGIRQKYFRLAHEQGWRKKYRIYIGSGPEYPGDYSQHLARSKFCLAVPGDGYSARYVDAMLHGCIPVVVMNNVSEAFEDILDYRQFTIRINESDIERTPQILQSITSTLLLQMQRSLGKVWHRYAWTGSALHRSQLPEMFKENFEWPYLNLRKHGYPPHLPENHPFRTRQQYPMREDAFATLMQWLHGRIKDTR